MIIAVGSYKGGVGKTALSTLLAVYASQNRGDQKVLLIDFDRNRGSSSIFFSNREPEITIMDAFKYYYEEPFDLDGTGNLLKQAIHRVEKYPNLYVMQSSKKLEQIAMMGLESTTLEQMIEASGLNKFPLILIDSGPQFTELSMSVAAADALIIPFMLSQQCVGPTKDTIVMAYRKKKQILALTPMAFGKSGWDRAMLDIWSEEIAKTPQLGWKIGLMDGIPQSASMRKIDLLTKPIPSIALNTVRQITESLEMMNAEREEE